MDKISLCMNRTTRIKITELNPHVICVLCGGYYINATTITECLHSFCRTCITRYLETSKYCPVCDVMVHKTRPLDYIRSDKTLQDLVYKLVPGLYKSEMKRRREYYADADPEGVRSLPSEDRGDEFHDRIIYTEDEKISLSLELCAEGVPFKTPTKIHGHNGPDNIRIRDVRYLQCPAAFSIGNLKKFIRMKFDLKLKFEIDIFHTAEPLPDYYSLMDIAYIYTWTRRAPLRLFYTVYERKLPPKAPDPLRCAQHTTSLTSGNQEERSTGAPDELSANKRRLMDGPDDISPDVAFDKTKPYRVGRRKVLGTPKKRNKKVIGEVDDSVKEALSESEEHLAKLSLLDTSGDVRNDSKRAINSIKNRVNEREEIEGDVENGAVSDETDEYTDDKDVDSVITEQNNVNTIHESDLIVKTNDMEVDVTENGAKIRNKECGASSKQSSAQVSPGSGSSISLSLFQPLNRVELESKEPETRNQTDETNALHKKEKDGKIYEFEDDKSEIVKKPRGRPKGSKNKVPKEKGAPEKDGSAEKKKKDIDSKLVPSKKKKLEVKNTDNASAETPKKVKTTKTKSLKSSEGSSSNSDTVEKVKRKYVRKTKAKGPADAARENKRLKTDSAGQGGSDATTGNTAIDGKDQNETSVTNGVSNDQDTTAVNCDGMDSKSDGKTDVSERTTVKEITDQQSAPVNTGSLQEPVTPLYGETPKVNESNQGLPCSPNMDSVDSVGRLVIDMGEQGEDLNGAKSHRSDDSVLKCSKTQSVGDKDKSVQNGNCISLCAFPKEIFRNSGHADKDCGINLAKSQEIPVAHSDHYRYNVNGFSPPSLLSMMGGFSPPPLSAHAHCSHVTGNSSIYQSHDHSDQPLDLTNGSTKDDYTKGKIFKTKMLKRPCSKVDQ